ncbi:MULTISPECIES: hypothetical protein [Dickeya]|uniref:Uncharacterized protein n=1 Tax=Dickeya aquatica TaxID=1401087 RepID=A0A375AEM9_9GAMM|nr:MULTISPECIES: hypothetical protein [Dickeya]SLM64550.1 FIG00613413: hypothetical protein [Dickeya aquatica]
MAAASFIAREAPAQDPDNLASLLRDALAEVQRLSGQRWSDYNRHDPGVTLLELLCFALSDLIYRTDFALPDYLTRPDGTLDYVAQGLMLPEQIFPARPSTRQDYQHAILSHFSDIEHVWVSSDAQGRYHIRFLLDDAARQRSTDDPAWRERLINDIARLYQRQRNLGEELADIRLIDSHGLQLHAEIALLHHDDADALAADIYHHTLLWLDDDSQPHDLPIASRAITSLYSHLIHLDAVAHIHRLRLLRSDQADAHAPVHIGPGDWLVLPKQPADIHLHLTYQGQALTIDFSAMLIRLAQRQRQKSTLSEQLRRQAASLSVPPQGQFRPLGEYRSIQSLFPAVYRLDTPASPGALNRQEQMQIQQFRGYLLLFEQLMANFCASLANLRTLFSTDIDTGHSYGFALLDDAHFAGINTLYPEQAARHFQALQAEADHYVERKGQLFDYLLALYGEQPDARFWQPLDNETDSTPAPRRLRYPQHFLEHIVPLTRERAGAACLDEPHHRGGFADRLTLLLGMNDAAGWPYSQVLDQPTHRFIDDEAFLYSDTGRWQLQWLPEAVCDTLLDVPLTPPPAADDSSPPESTWPHERLWPDDDNPVSARYRQLLAGLPQPVSLLARGIRLAHYQILARPQQGDYQALFRLTSAPGLWLSLGYSPEPAPLITFINQLRRVLLRLNRLCEGIYVVEHDVLRPSSDGSPHTPDSADPYFAQLSLVLPGYSARGSDPVFRHQAERLIASQSPAHLFAHSHWLSLEAMRAFERSYLDWRSARASAPGSMACEQAAAQLMACLAPRLSPPQPACGNESETDMTHSSPQGQDA